ncbi:MAG: hypothetical protein ACJA15_002670, partial [Flavobacteriales bacterium]
LLHCVLEFYISIQGLLKELQLYDLATHFLQLKVIHLQLGPCPE